MSGAWLRSDAGGLGLGAVLRDGVWVVRRTWHVTQWLAVIAAVPLWLVALGAGEPPPDSSQVASLWSEAPGGPGARERLLAVEVREGVRHGQLGPLVGALGVGPWVCVAGLLIYSLTGGAQVLAVARALQGEAPDLGEALGGALRRYGALMRATVLMAGAPLLLMAGVVVWAGGMGPEGTLLLLLGVVVVLVGGETWASMWPQAIVLEGASGALAGLRRSVQLVRGRFGAVLGLGAALGLGVAGVQLVLFGVARGVGVAPGGWVWAGLEQVGGALGWALTAVWGTVVYFRLRARQEEGPGLAEEA